MVPVICIVGRSDVGKTTFIERLLPELKARGYRVATVKHDVHGFDLDRPGKDSWRHAQAGSDAVIISSPDRVAMIKRVEVEWPLEQIAHYLAPDVDLLVTEGYKRERFPKIEVHRRELGEELLCSPEELLALVTDEELPLPVPQFGWEEAAAVASLIEERFLRPRDGYQVSLWADGTMVPLKPWAREFLGNTIRGIASAVKGAGNLDFLDVRVKRRGD
jgi:molybdopterin-guanine dinucleotide biosynthesis protein B